MEAIADIGLGEHEGYGFRWADKPMDHARYEACPKCGSVHFRLPLTRPIAQTHSEPAMDNDRSGSIAAIVAQIIWPSAKGYKRAFNFDLDRPRGTGPKTAASRQSQTWA